MMNMSKQAMIFVLMAMTSLSDLASGDFYDWYVQPYGDQSFTTDAKFNTNVTLLCHDDRVGNYQYRAEYWILPDLTVMNPDDVIRFNTLDGLAGWQVSVDAMEMQIILLQPIHFGFYYCIVTILDDVETGINDTAVIKRAINYQGPYFGSIWSNYEKNFIVAFSASGVYLLIAAATYIVYWFMFKRHPSPVEPLPCRLSPNIDEGPKLTTSSIGNENPNQDYLEESVPDEVTSKIEESQTSKTTKF